MKKNERNYSKWEQNWQTKHAVECIYWQLHWSELFTFVSMYCCFLFCQYSNKKNRHFQFYLFMCSFIRFIPKWSFRFFRFPFYFSFNSTIKLQWIFNSNINIFELQFNNKNLQPKNEKKAKKWKNLSAAAKSLTWK